MSQPASPRSCFPADLQSLSEAFALLEQGETVYLSNKPGHSFVPPPPGQAPALGVFSSGSTGAPKLCWRPWSQLKAETRVSPETQSWKWASPFSPATFAGVQVALQSWAARGQVLSLPLDFARAADLLKENAVDALSCTPTYLNLLLQEGESLHAWKPAQITLGGEVLRPQTAERFRHSFPETSFRVIYASAEFGVLLKTHRLDGWYETRVLDQRYPEWRIYDGQLQLRKDGHWRKTGDLVEVKDKLIRVLGRTNGIANIGGSKINLYEVASLAEQVPGVRHAFAFAAKNPITGEVVALRITPETGVDHEALRQKVEFHLHPQLRKEAWPRRWEFSDLTLGPNTKEACP